MNGYDDNPMKHDIMYKDRRSSYSDTTHNKSRVSVLIAYLSLESNIGRSIRTQSLSPLSYLDSRFYPYWLTLCNLGVTQVFIAVPRTSQTRFHCKNSTVTSCSRKREVKHIYYPKQGGPNVRHSFTCDVVITGFQAFRTQNKAPQSSTDLGPPPLRPRLTWITLKDSARTAQ
jgi:hypothetical protein